jgi:hypothetical protein
MAGDPRFSERAFACQSKPSRALGPGDRGIEACYASIMAVRLASSLAGFGLAALAPVAWALLGACGTSGATTTTDVDGGPPASACVFTTRYVYDCPGQPLTPTAWETQCQDGVDCASLQPSSATVDGCTRLTEIENGQNTPGTCAQLGATNTTQDATSPLVLDAGGPVQPCAPLADAGDFSPTWHTPRVAKGSCTQAQIDSFRQCIDDVDTIANPASCQQWYPHPITSGDQNCFACLQSLVGDDTWGPFVRTPTEMLINVPGCIAIQEQHLDGTGCGGALAASQECGRTVCAPVCPVGSSVPATAATERAQEEACEKQSEQGVCAPFTGPAECAGRIVAGDAGTPDDQKCFGLPTQSKDAVFEAVGLVFCGP